MKKLIPPDRARCQAEIPNGASFMTLGGRPELVRCTSAPTVIVREKLPGKDGQRGSMSLCGVCLVVFKQQLGEDFADVIPNPPEAEHRAGKPAGEGG